MTSSSSASHQVHFVYNLRGAGRAARVAHDEGFDESMCVARIIDYMGEGDEARPGGDAFRSPFTGGRDHWSLAIAAGRSQYLWAEDRFVTAFFSPLYRTKRLARPRSLT